MENGTHRLALRQWHVDYRSVMLMQFEFFIISSISHVKVSGPPQKARLDWRVVCIVLDVLEG
jgi:hypothetical protein